MNKTEKKAFWILTGVLIIITSIPYMTGFLLSDSGGSFAGYIENPRDTLSYYMWMRQVYEGEYLLNNMFAPEPQPRIYFNPFFFSAGFLARVFHIVPHQFYWIYRIPVAVLFLYIAFRFIMLVFEHTGERIWCFGLVCFSSGLGWLVSLPKLLAGDLSPVHYPVDFFSPSAITFWTVMSQPHVAFSQAAMFLYMICLARFHMTGRFIWILWSGLILGFTVINHTYDIVILGSISLVYLIVLLSEQSTIKRSVFIPAGLYIAFCTGISSWYILYVLRSNETLKYWSEQSSSPYISPDSYILGAGLLFPAAVIGLYRFSRERKTQMYIPVIWFCLLPLLIYFFIFQPAKLANGMHIVLCMLAVYGLSGWFNLGDSGSKKVTTIVLVSVLLTCPSNLVVLSNNLFRHVMNPEPLPSLDRFYYPEPSLWTGFQWLDKNTANNDTIMCSRLSGWMIPGFAGNRSLLGHRDFSMNLEEKHHDYHKYYVYASDRERRELLTKYGIKYVWVGPDEHMVMTHPFRPDPSLEPVFAYEDLVIYRVIHK